MKILVINGPNINMLGVREKEIYGTETYDNLIGYINEVCARNNIEVECFQSNHEGAIVDKIQSALGVFDGIVINPAAYTHTSIAILDAMKAVALPAVEVHLSDISKREEYRKKSFVSEACIKTFCGLSFKGYELAILLLQNYLSGKQL